MARISMTGARRGGFNREKAKPGVYVASLLNLRDGKDRQGLGFHIDFTLVECVERFEKDDGTEWDPSRPGGEYHDAKYPENVVASGGLSRDDVVNLEKGKIQAIIGAALGYERGEADFVDDDVYDAVVMPNAERGKPQKISKMKGRKFLLTSVPHVNKKREDTVFYRFDPLPEAGKVSRSEVLGAPPALAADTDADDGTKTTEALKPAPKAPPKPKAAPKSFPPAGWTMHPDTAAEEAPDARYWYNDAGECITEVELRARA